MQRRSLSCMQIAQNKAMLNDLQQRLQNLDEGVHLSQCQVQSLEVELQGVQVRAVCNAFVRCSDIVRGRAPQPQCLVQSLEVELQGVQVRAVCTAFVRCGDIVRGRAPQPQCLVQSLEVELQGVQVRAVCTAFVPFGDI